MVEKELLLQQYSSLMLEYLKYKNFMINEMENLLIKNNIKYQNLTSRIKENKSLSDKLNNPNIINEIKGDIKNLNDICGIRIILYDNINLNKTINIIDENFEICDFKNKKLGYNANNITVKVKDEMFKDYKCEIQLVTVMTHNLIELGHDIVYKNKDFLKKIDIVEYEEITNEYKECLDEVYKLETRIENIKKRAQNICDKYNLYRIVISDEYIKEIEQNRSLLKFFQITNDVESLTPFLSRNIDKAQEFFDKKIIVKLSNSIINLDDEGIYTKEFVFDNYMKLLSHYSNLWIYDINSIFKILISYLSIKNNYRMKNSFYEMIRNIIIFDIKTKKWIIFSKIKEWIVSNTDYPEYRIKIVNNIINNNISYIEEVDILKFNIITKDINYNDDGKKMIIDLFNYCCDLFINNQTKVIYDELLNFVYKFSFLSDEILEYFYNKYDDIDDIYKFDLIKKIYSLIKNEMFNNKYYKKIKQEKIYEIYKFLVYDYFDELFEKKDWKKIQEKGRNIINNYIKNINNKNYKDILRLLDCYETLNNKSNYNLIRFEKFIFCVGRKYKFSDKLYRKNKNPYLYLGIKNSNKNIKTRYDIKVLSAMDHVYEKKVFLDMFKNRKNNRKKDTIFCEIITNTSNNLYKNNKIKKKFFDIISYYNKKKIFIIDVFLSEKFIKNISSHECDIILENYSYISNGNFANYDINIMNIFNYYPQNVRDYIIMLINKSNRNKIKYPLKMYINNCNNYNEERKNNILLILQLLKKQEYFEIYKYVDDLVQKDDQNIVNDLIDIIKVDNSSEMRLAISKFLCEVELGLTIWKVARMIILNDEDERINRNIFNALIDVGVVNSFSEAYYIRLKELIKIKKTEENEKLRKYLSNLIKYYKTNIEVEKLKEINYKNEMKVEFESNRRLKNK